MPDTRFPTLAEFWRRLEVRRLEPDLLEELRQRLNRDLQPMSHLPVEPTRSVVARLVPATIPVEALVAFVDEHFNSQLGRADDRAGLLPRAQLIPLGLELLDRESKERHGHLFGELPSEAQDALLAAAERGNLTGTDKFDWSTWFRRFRALVLLGLGSDPRGMVFMGFPGPSYRTGHVWLDEGEVAARAVRRPGYLQL
jgi:hypothetical protein